MRLRLQALASFAFVFAALAGSAACGKAAGPLSASAPSGSSVAPAPSPSLSGATIAGTVSAPTSGITVGVTGTTMRAAVDTAGRFSLTGVPAGNIELQFQAAGIDARLPLANVVDHERIQIRVVLNGNDAALDAAERLEPDDRAEVRGPITSIDTTARTFSVGSTSVRVPAGVDIRRGAATVRFEDLREQERVQVEGASQGGVVVASQVELEDLPQQPEPEPEPQPNDAQLELKGTMTGLTGGCPVVSFDLAGRNVRAAVTTVFSGGTCSDLRDGRTVEVKGPAQPDGSVAAATIKIDN